MLGVLSTKERAAKLRRLCAIEGYEDENVLFAAAVADIVHEGSGVLGGQRMSEAYSAEIYRQEGDEFRSIRLSVSAEGAVRLDAQDMGKLTKEIWGDDDYEFWVDVPATALPKLVFALIRDKYSGRNGSVDEFRALCEREGIEHTWDSWI